MIKFHDGPAHGVTLYLRRAPFFLRVTHCHESGKDKWDGLDQLEDRAEEHESLYLYRVRPIRMGMAFIDGTRNGRRSGWSSVITEYDYVTPQPPDAIMRDDSTWCAWCDQQATRPEVNIIFEKWKAANTHEPR
jgi:hypothetical protein